MTYMSDTVNNVFAKRIQQVMTENGWSKSDLAKKVILSHTAVQNWAKGKSVASGARLKRLAAVTGKPEYWFFMDYGEVGDENQFNIPVPRQLDEQEETLLSLFNQLPESEKLRLIIHTKGVLKELELLKNDVFNIINDSRKQ